MALLPAALIACRQPPPAGPDAAAAGPDAAEAPDAAAPDASIADGGKADSSVEGRPLELTARAIASSGALDLKRPGPSLDLPLDVRFEVDMPRLADVRVRLFDSSDRAVPSTDHLESTRRTAYSLKPDEPLAAGSRYSLVVDGVREDVPLDEAGNRYEIVRFELRTESPPPPPKPPAKPAKGKRR